MSSMHRDQEEVARGAPAFGSSRGRSTHRGDGPTPPNEPPVTPPNEPPVTARTTPSTVNGPLAPHRNCVHPRAAWAARNGMSTCGVCGTRRVTDYRALGLALELPERTQLYGPTRTHRGTARLKPGRSGTPAASCREDLHRRVAEANRRSTAGRPWQPSATLTPPPPRTG
ncbi:DUF6255 family natural product biosynthesis protein [Streptomyces sp. AV19]|uniref:DUF6255 family natural product biosynthesis protein n=1 Tax=Streptomyces sp. AV19 TaxID=2793068 RepID=UPI0035ABD41A